MKKQPEIKDFTVPSSVYVNMHNDNDYIRIPLSNLEESEINTLLSNFEREVRKAAEVGYPPKEARKCSKCGGYV